MERLSRVALPGLLLLGLYYAFFGGRFSVFELRGAEEQRTELERELFRLQRENDELRDWADALENDPVALERIAREKYRMVKPGERLYLVPEESPVDGASDAGDATIRPEPGAPEG